jgi:hypothetical protein
MTEENFSSPSIRTGSKDHPASYSMRTFGILPRIKATSNNYFNSHFVVPNLRMCGVTSSASNHGIVFNKSDGKISSFFTFQNYKINFKFKICKSMRHRTVQINHQPDATIFQFMILTFIYSSTCFGRYPAHHLGA